jgi:hypothetical protein
MDQPNPAFTPVGPRTSTMAIISLIGGIAGWTVLPFLGALAGIIFGHIAKSEIKKSAGMVTGNGMATAGLILGYLSIALGLCLFCVWLLLTLGLFTLPFAIPTIGNTGY